MPGSSTNGPSAKDQKIQDLERRLAEAEAALQAITAGQAQLASAKGDGYLSRVAQEELAQERIDAETRLMQANSALVDSNLLLEESKRELEIELAERERTENLLTISQRRIHEILSSIRDGFMALDRQWCFIYVNERAAESGGFRPEDLIGRNLWKMFPALLGTPLEKTYRQVMETGEQANLETRGVLTGAWYEVSVYPSDEGITVYWLDKTAQKQAAEEAEASRRDQEVLRRQVEAERALFAAVIANAPEGIVVADSQARVVMANPAAERLYARPVPYGQDYGSHAEMQLCDLNGNPISPRDLPLTRSALDGETFTDVEMVIVWPDEQRRSLLVTSAPIVEADGKVTGAVGIFRDITERLILMEQVQAERARLDAVLRQLPVGVLIVEAPSGRPVMANVQLDLIWRKPFVLSEDGVDYGAYPRLHLDGRDYLPGEWPLLRALHYGEVIVNEEAQILRGDGTTGMVSISAAPVFNLEGDIIAVVSVYHDITAQKEMEAALRQVRDELAQRVVERTTALAESETRLSAVIESLPVLLWRIDAQGVLTMMVGRGLRRMGLSEKDLIGKNAFEYFASQPGMVSSFRRALAGEAVVHVAPTVTSADRIFETHYLPQTDAQGRVVGVIGLSIDVTERARAEAELQEYHDRLQELVEERTAELEEEIRERGLVEEALQEYAERLERSNRDLEDFAFIASHDLQEPLRKIQAFGERLEARYSNHLEPEGRDYLDRMRNAAARMNRMIQDLLAYSRVSTRTQPFELVDLGATAREVVTDLETILDATHGRVEIGALPKLMADPSQMNQLMQNLIGNALKFHRQNQPPEVSVTSRQVSAGMVEILVEDNGVGFDMQYLDRIFQPFQRLHGRSEFEGSGIGLSICRRIAERHGGSITARSAPGQGALFIVSLPANH